MRRVSACASDQVARRANASMRASCEAGGVRWARVPMGGEACTFCAMLASRGFVYRTSGSAGAGDHWHRGCRCKVVPETAGAVEGYDPDEWHARWRAMEEIDRDERLTPDSKRAAKSAVSIAPAGFASPEASMGIERADSYTSRLRKAWSEFRRKKTADNYESTVGAVVSAIGEAEGVRASCEYGALPNGDEVVAAMSLANESVVFRRELQGQRNPDVFIDGVMMEIKTPESMRKVSKRLLHAAAQFDSYPAERKVCLLSTLRLPAGSDPSGVARGFVEDGTLDEVVIVNPAAGAGKGVVYDLKER